MKSDFHCITKGEYISKLLLNLEDPKNCKNCQFCRKLYDDIDEAFCTLADDLEDDDCYRTIDYRTYKNKKQKWCPLKLVSEKQKRDWMDDEYYTGYVDGLNSCVDEILGGNQIEMYKLIRKLMPENDMMFRDICSFETDNYIGIWNHYSDSYVLFAKEDCELYLRELRNCENLDELYEEVYNITEEYITGVSDDSNYTFTLDCDK